MKITPLNLYPLLQSVSYYTLPSYTSSHSGNRKVLLVPLCYHPYFSSVTLTIIFSVCVFLYAENMSLLIECLYACTQFNIFQSIYYQHWKIYCKSEIFIVFPLNHNARRYVNVNWSFFLPFLVLWPVRKAWRLNSRKWQLKRIKSSILRLFKGIKMSMSIKCLDELNKKLLDLNSLFNRNTENYLLQ